MIELLAQLRVLGVKLWQENNELCYQAPKGVFTSELRAELALHKEEILAFLKAVAASTDISTSPITPAPPARERPLSFAQQRLWFLNQLESSPALYNIPAALQLTGSLDVLALTQSINEIVRRHQVLRTAFIKVGDQPVQDIAPTLLLELPVVDLQLLPGPQRKVEERYWINQEAQRPFDLAQIPLLRIVLLRRAELEHILMFTAHHIIFDGWSITLLLRELAVLYESISTGRSASLPLLSIQYVDFAVWQRQWLQGEVLAEQVAYWKQQLGGTLPMLELPRDRLGPIRPTTHGATQSLTLPPQLVTALKRLSLEENATLFMVTLAAFEVLLHRYTRQSDIVLGTPVANRNRSEMEGLIGCFVNTLVLRLDLSGDPTFLELLKQVRKVALDAYAHQDLPFEMLVEALQPERHLNRTPFFQVMFDLQTIPPLSSALVGLVLQTLEIESDTAKFDLSLTWTEMAQQTNVAIEYRTDLFTTATIIRMLGHFQALLEGIVANPTQRIARFPLLTTKERFQLLHEWNNPGLSLPPVQDLPNLFESQAAQRPDAVAVVCGSEHLTYEVLNRRVNQLAHYLRTFGVEPEALVGVCLERSLDAVVTLLGVFKTGGAYVPLDPAFPQGRLGATLQDVQPRVLVTRQKIWADLPQSSIPVICLDHDWGSLVQENEHNLHPQSSASNLAYVIYTSGSTGQPKGVMISRGALTRYVLTAASHFALTPHDRVLQFASISFDAAAEEIFSCLLSGATLVLRDDTLLDSVANFTRSCWLEHITLLDLPTAYWHNIIAELETVEWPSSVRLVVIGGEQARPELLQTWQAHVPSQVRLINSYGPTETTIVATFCDLVSAEQFARTDAPIGRPVAHTRIYVLDTQLQPLPIGVPGELYIGGPSVARGYLNRPDLTAERFIPNPFSEEAALTSATESSRLYKTGDRARYLSDGNLEFLGRVDSQVKLRGYRIELGEIEAVLRQHPQVQETVVLSYETERSLHDQKLVAYFVARTEAKAQQPDLRIWLKEQLPEYMLPAAFIRLDAFPLTPHGKIDRHALPVPDWDKLRTGRPPVFPRTPMEQTLMDIWTQVLGVKQISVHDSFFELGGHSLLAARVISRIRQVFETELSLRSLFEEPTIASMAQQIQAARQKGPELLLPPIKPIVRAGAIPLSSAQQRLWFLSQLEPDSSAYHIFAALLLEGRTRPEALQQSLNEVVQRHEVLRTRIVASEGQPTQIIEPTLDFSLPVVDLTELDELSRATQFQYLATEEALRPFDLAQGPLMRVNLFRLEDSQHVLFLTMHHIVSDGWSIDLLIQELNACYRGAVSGQFPTLPELPVQYADYALWQRTWLQEESLLPHLSYWKRQLGGELPVLELPYDRPYSTLPARIGAAKTLLLSAALTQALRDLSQRARGTLFMTLLAALNLLLHRYTGQTDLVIGVPIAGRGHPELERLIGCFLNTLALRTNWQGELSFLELLDRVREVCLSAFDHQDLPFERLVEELHLPRKLGHTPIFDVMFNFVNAPRSVPEFEELHVKFLDLVEPEPKFAITLYVLEQADTIELKLVYRRDLFSDERMVVWLDQFRRLLEQIAAGPERSIATYSLVTPASWAVLPDPGLELSEPNYALITDLLAAGAESSADRIAVCQGGRNWTYQELVQQAKFITYQLLARGLHPGDTVAVLGPRSFGLIASMLGVFLSGGVLLNIDANLPPKRQQVMLHEAKAKFLLCLQPESGKVPAFNEWPSLTVLPLELDTGKALDIQVSASGINLPQISANDPAYIFFTSGTTGVPKGVLGCHKGLAQFVTWQRTQFALGKNDRFAQLTALSFDVILRDVLTPLLSGGTVCIPEGEYLEPHRLLPWLDDEAISALHLVPALAHSWLGDVPDGVTLRRLRWVFFAGEPLTATLIQQWRAALPESGQIVNLYGPTETTLAKCFYQVPADVLPGVQPIGWPLPQTQALVLANERLCGIGEPGEIVLRTPFRSLGYVNAPEENQRRFIPNPFHRDAGDLLYRSGDRGRYRLDGSLEILGRFDHQIKIRGMRVDLGEIEDTLSRHPGLRQAVVKVREDGQGDKHLVAYIVCAEPSGPTGGELRRFLQEYLPAHLVPALYVPLASLPLGANGKVDRHALPEPVNYLSGSDETYVPPQDEMERLLATVWQECLQVERVGMTENFFDLGGHSLLLIKVQSRLRHLLDRDLPILALFQYPTIRALATYLSQRQEAPQSFKDSRIRAEHRRQALSKRQRR